MNQIDDKSSVALQQAARATAAEPKVSALRDGIANAHCTCGEVCGEDPRCALHGRHTEWAKDNPENYR